MKYERLTQKETMWSDRIKIFEYYSVATEEDKNQAINRLGELEDKIENGTLVEFPCIRQVEKCYFVYYLEDDNIIDNYICESLKKAEAKLKELKERK